MANEILSSPRCISRPSSTQTERSERVHRRAGRVGVRISRTRLRPALGARARGRAAARTHLRDPRVELLRLRIQTDVEGAAAQGRARRPRPTISQARCSHATARIGVGHGAVTGKYGRRSVLLADVLGPLCAYRCDVVLGGPDFTIVLGFDGSPRAEDALALGELLAVRGGARLVVVCIYMYRRVVSLERGEQARSTAARAGAVLHRRSRWASRAVPALSVEEGLLAAVAERAVATRVSGGS